MSDWNLFWPDTLFSGWFFLVISNSKDLFWSCAFIEDFCPRPFRWIISYIIPMNNATDLGFSGQDFYEPRHTCECGFQLSNATPPIRVYQTAAVRCKPSLYLVRDVIFGLFIELWGSHCPRQITESQHLLRVHSVKFEASREASLSPWAAAQAPPSVREAVIKSAASAASPKGSSEPWSSRPLARPPWQPKFVKKHVFPY